MIFNSGNYIFDIIINFILNKRCKIINLNTKYLEKFINSQDFINYNSKLEQAHDLLYSKNYCYTDKRGWLDLPVNITQENIYNIQEFSKKISKICDTLIIIGIGGSYLGIRAAVEFIKSCNYNYLEKQTPNIFFVGNNMSESYINNILKICENKNICVNIISKSGNTLECMTVFRIFKNFMENKYGKQEARERIFCTTDLNSGCLREIALYENYKIFGIPDNIGGRYSVLSNVGLVPLSILNININLILEGARQAREDFLDLNINNNICYKYSVIRNILYNKHKNIEIISSFEPRLKYLFEWWKQLFGESEGKNKLGIFPSSLIYSTDLHSMGQFVQDGTPNFFETIITFKNYEQNNNTKIPYSTQNLDNLNYISGYTIQDINNKILQATMYAHYNSGTPIINLELDEINEYNFGYLVYFFEKSCAISAHILGVDPFNQPGVEAYKTKMLELLNKN